MGQLHTMLQNILNVYSETGIQNVSEEAGCLMLELNSCISDDLQKTIAIGGDDSDIMKMDTNTARFFAQNLKEENLELKKKMEINDFFSLHALKIHPRDFGKLREISKLFVESGGRLDPDNLLWLTKHNFNSPESRREDESVELERKNRLRKLGGLKIKK